MELGGATHLGRLRGLTRWYLYAIKNQYDCRTALARSPFPGGLANVMRGEGANEKIHDVLTQVTLLPRGLLQADVPLLSE